MGKNAAKTKEWAEKPAYLAVDSAKFAIGINRGPPWESDEGADLEKSKTTDTITLENIKRTPTQNLKRHLLRFWCCYLFWNIIFLAIFLPLFFKKAIPAVAQNVVDRSTLLLTHASILQPRPDNIVLSMGAALKLPLSLPARIDPMTLELFNRENPMNNTWGKIYLGPYTIIGNTSLGVQNQPTPIDPEQWYDYVWKVVHLNHPPLSVRGGTTAYLGKLVNPITLDKDIPQTTLGNFSGFSLADSQLLLKPRPDGTNLLANATLPNPSVLTLEIGDTLLDVYSGDILVGNATLPNLFLRPGNHSTPVEGIIDIGKLFKNIDKFTDEQIAALKEGNLQLKTIGREVHYEGVEVPYYTKVMKTLTLPANVAIGGLLTNTVEGLVNQAGGNPLSNITTVEPATNGDSRLSDEIAGITSRDLAKRKLKRALEAYL